MFNLFWHIHILAKNPFLWPQTCACFLILSPCLRIFIRNNVTLIHMGWKSRHWTLWQILFCWMQPIASWSNLRTFLRLPIPIRLPTSYLNHFNSWMCPFCSKRFDFLYLFLSISSQKNVIKPSPESTWYCTLHWSAIVTPTSNEKKV